MTQAEKERLALSTVLAIVLYAAVLLATGWLNLLTRSGPAFYAGPVLIEIALDPSVSPREVTGIDEPAETVAQTREPPVEETTPVPVEQSEPVQTTQERAVPEPTTPETAIEPVPDVEPATTPEPQAVSESVQPDEVVPSESTTTQVPSEAAPPARGSSTATADATGAEPATQSGATAAGSGETTATERGGETAEGQTTRETPVGPTRTPVASPWTNSTGVVEGVPDEVERSSESTNSSEVIYGTDQQTFDQRTTADQQGVSSQAGSGDGNLVDRSNLANADAALARASDDTAGQESGTTGGQGETAGATGSVGAEQIVAEDLEDLERQRQILVRVNPDLPTNALPDGQRSVEVSVTFRIQPTGLVSDISISRSSGYASVDAAVIEALRRWKFQPISGDRTVGVRLRWVITAT